jgi:predicted DNA-binding WGR domain protein
MMSTIYLLKIDHSTNQYRYYSLRIDPNLFGGWTLIRQWGRLDYDGGRLKMDTFESEKAALDRLTKIVTQKKKRGYQ